MQKNVLFITLPSTLQLIQVLVSNIYGFTRSVFINWCEFLWIMKHLISVLITFSRESWNSFTSSIVIQSIGQKILECSSVTGWYQSFRRQVVKRMGHLFIWVNKILEKCRMLWCSYNCKRTSSRHVILDILIITKCEFNIQNNALMVYK